MPNLNVYPLSPELLRWICAEKTELPYTGTVEVLFLTM